jgi:SAM-dependent methyltransferase
VEDSGKRYAQRWEWVKFLDPGQTLSLLGLNHGVVNVADFSCDYGTFTIPAARIISGKIYAFDIEPEMINDVEQKAKGLNQGNVEAILRDLISEGSELNDGSINYVFLFNVLHGEKPDQLLRSHTEFCNLAVRLDYSLELDAKTRRGPPTDISPRPEQCRRWAESERFIFEQKFAPKPYH